VISAVFALVTYVGKFFDSLVAGSTYLRIEPEFVVFRSWPLPERRIPRGDIDRFVVLPGEQRVVVEAGDWDRPNQYLALLTKDGHHFRVPSNDPEPAISALRLNNELRR
jgi:hypothetical protein